MTTRNPRLFALSFALSLATALLFVPACGGDEEPRIGADTAESDAAQPGLDTAALDTAGLDSGTPDAAASDSESILDAAPPDDIAVSPETTHGDTAGDVAPPDTGPPAGRALGWVWTDPSAVEVEPPVMVHLPHVTGMQGRLTGPYADVLNCINEPGGLETVQWVNGSPMTIALCNLRQTVTLDPDGNYLSVTPPANWKNPNDAFAEVQMYYHVNRVHDWFAAQHGYTGMDRPMTALVNLQVGLKTGNYVWLSIDNAAYMPAESIAQLSTMIGVAPPVDGDAIIFAQGPELDLSYDGDVVYHEYTHALIGGGRLWGTRADEYGADAAPLALNEAHADYFTASLTEDARIGFWSLGKLGALRDLREERRCPDHLIGQSHWDGQIFSSALWGVREALGAEIADAIVFDALLTYEPLTGFDDAVEAILANAAALDPPRDAEVRAVFARHGLPGCDRVVPLEADTLSNNVFLPGTYGTGVPAFAAGAPAYVQTSFEVPAGEVSTGEGDSGPAALTLSWDRAPDGMAGLMGMFGSEPEPIELDVALKRGGAAIRWTYEPGGPQIDADGVFTATRDGDSYTLTVAGSCLVPGRHTLQLVNRSEVGGSMRRPRVTAHDTLPAEGVVAYDCAD